MTDIPVWYKQTEVGIIPNDWDVLQMNEICTSFRLWWNYKNTDRVNENILIKMWNLWRWVINLNKVEYIIWKPNPNDKLKYGMLLLNTRNTPELVWKIAIRNIKNMNAYYNSNLLYLNINPNKHSSFFVNYQMNTQKNIFKMNKLAKWTTSVAAIYTRDLEKFKIAIPSSLPEQQAIATTLSDMDELISSLDELIEKKKNIKKWAMQKLLSPKEWWIETTLGEIFYWPFSGSSKSSQINDAWNYIIMDMGSVSQDWKNIAYKRIVSNKDLLKKWELVMPKDDIWWWLIIWKTVVIPEDNKYVLWDHVYKLVPKTANPEFISYLINSQFVNSYLKQKVTGSAQLWLWKQSVIEQEVHIPPTTEEQQEIATILSDMDKEIEALEEKKAKYEQIKQWAMQKLLTGKIRLV